MRECVRKSCDNVTMFGMCNSCRRDDLIRTDYRTSQFNQIDKKGGGKN